MSQPSKPPQPAQSVRLRRVVAGAAIIGCPLAGLLSALVDAEESTDTTGTELYEIALAHSEGIWLAGVLFIISAILTVPTATGLFHLAAGHSARRAHLGVLFLVLGGFGHMGYGTWQVVLSTVPGPGDPASIAAYLDRATAVHAILLPLMLSIIVGLILCALAARRSRLLPSWVPGVLIAAAVFDVVIQSTSLGSNKWVPAVTWALAFLALAPAGLVVLRMPDPTWVGLYPHQSTTATAHTPTEVEPTQLSRN